MERDEKNPYRVLGIDENATPSQIKTAYRQAALRSHPDKQQTDEARERASETFALISNAYEILSDPEKKRQYDLQQQPPLQTRFHDPFEVFESVFREEFGQPSSGLFREHDSFFRRRGGMMDPFFGDDPFFSQSPMPGGGLFGSFFGGRDPFDDMQRMHENIHQRMFPHHAEYTRKQRQDGVIPRGGPRFSRDPRYEDEHGQQQQPQQQQYPRDEITTPQRHYDPFQELHRMHQGFSDPMFQQPNGNGKSYYSSSSTSSSTTTMRNGETVTTRTTTQRVNGKEQTITERIIRKADGTVERQVDRTGDEDFPSQLEQDRTVVPQLPAEERQPSGKTTRAEGARPWWKW